MQKLICFKATRETNTFIFKNIEKPAAQAPTTGGSLAERVEHNLNPNLNVESLFNPDYNMVFNDLGAKAKEKNPDLNPDSIKQNLTDTLAPGKTMELAWAYLQENACQTAAIVDGRLRFFAGADKTKEIVLSEFYKPLSMKIGGEGTVTHEYLLRRQEMLQQSMQSLQALKGELPELPKQKIS